MSELKVYHCNEWHNEYTEFYLKYEADKVIADLEMKLARAQLVLRLNEPKALYSDLEIMGRLRHEIDVVARRERHQKYKRCLVMARWCKSNVLYYEQRIDKCWSDGNASMHKEFYQRWYKRWLKLAEKFKEA